jgi:ATP-dependent Lhr-like helicase
MRIHKLTLEGLRQQIKPVPVEEFQLFLFTHQHVSATARADGKQGLFDVVRQLAGFDAAAGAWESEILASRVDGYQQSWLDELTHSGLVSWGRLKPPKRDDESEPRSQGMNRAVPLALFPRDGLAWLAPTDADQRGKDILEFATGKAAAVYEAILAGGAQFFGELKTRTGLIESELEDALGELCWLGLIHADGFAAIRPFVARNRKAVARVRYGVSKQFFAGASYSLGGRWAKFPGALPPVSQTERVELWAQLLLSRYGIVFRDLLARESAAPSWGELARCYRTMEARGLVRGGRFVAGPFGEQFALPEAVPQLRAMREKRTGSDWAVISAADPLNLVGILSPGAKVPSSRQAVLGFVDGRHVATSNGGDIEFLTPVPTELEGTLRHALQVSGAFRYGSPLKRGRAKPKQSEAGPGGAISRSLC